MLTKDDIVGKSVEHDCIQNIAKIEVEKKQFIIYIEEHRNKPISAKKQKTSRYKERTQKK